MIELGVVLLLVGLVLLVIGYVQRPAHPGLVRGGTIAAGIGLVLIVVALLLPSLTLHDNDDDYDHAAAYPAQHTVLA